MNTPSRSRSCSPTIHVESENSENLAMNHISRSIEQRTSTPPPTPTGEEDISITNAAERIVMDSQSDEDMDDLSHVEGGQIYFSDSFEMNSGEADQASFTVVAPSLFRPAVAAAVAAAESEYFMQSSNHLMHDESDEDDDSEYEISNITHNYFHEDEQDDNISIIRMDDSNLVEQNMAFNFDRWIWTDDDDMMLERRRRSTALREIEQAQRSNFLHFVLFCLIPTSLLLILMIAVMDDEGECSKKLDNECYRAQTQIFNPFNRVCVCDALVL